MKRVCKVIAQVVLGLLILALLFFSGFKVTEYVRGRSFISYLEANHESTPFEGHLDFNLVDPDVDRHQLILVGEIHGFKEPTRFEPEFFEYLHHSHQVNDYLIEMDISQAYFMNKYNQSGNEDILKRVLKNWVVTIGRENQDYRKKWETLREVYTKTDGFTYYGNNEISDIDLLVDYVNEITNSRIEIPVSSTDSVRLLSIKRMVNKITWKDSLHWEKEYIIRNIDYTLTKKYREEILTENLERIYQKYNLQERKVFGYYGLGHTLLAPLDDGYKAMAARFSTIMPEMKGKILSFVMVFIDSYMNVYSKNQPTFIRDKGRFTALSVSYDNIWVSYLHGIEELKRISTQNSKTLIKLNGERSPYSETRRLITMSAILPLGMTINGHPDLVTTDYFQYLILMRNSAEAKE
ncbi:MAG: hypothetical protein AAF620_18560 [Bacteroidota bacterium]